MKDKSLCIGDQIMLIKPLNSQLAKVGFKYSIGAINQDSFTIRDCNTGLALTTININDFDEYFEKINEKAHWSAWGVLYGVVINTNCDNGIVALYRTNRQKVQVKIDNFVGQASCNLKNGDSFNLAYGVQLALLRCKAKIIKNFIDNESSQTLIEQYVDEHNAIHTQIKNFLKHTK